MKVALCLSGQPRSVEQAFPYIKENIIKPNNPDIYVHAWVDENIRGGLPLNAGGHLASNPIPENIDDIILNLYGPTKYKFEEQIEFEDKNYNERKAPMIKPKNSQSQWYSVKQAFSLIEERYDAIIRMRFDWGIKIPIRVKDYNLDVVTSPNDCPHYKGINDQFAFSIHDHMMVYAQLYDHIDYIYNEQGIRYCDEQMLVQHLENFGIGINPVKIPYEIIRHQEKKHQKFEGDFYE